MVWKWSTKRIIGDATGLYRACYPFRYQRIAEPGEEVEVREMIRGWRPVRMMLFASNGIRAVV